MTGMMKYRIYGYRAQSCYIYVEASDPDVALKYAQNLGSSIAVHLHGPVKCVNFGAKVQALKEDAEVDYIVGDNK